VHAVGVTVPEPLWLCDDLELLGRPFYIMRLVDGIALGPKIVKTLSLGGDREALGWKLGAELAKIHSIQPPVNGLEFLSIPDDHPSTRMIQQLQNQLDSLDTTHPVLEWGLRWAEYNLPQKNIITLVHQDYRTGNYLIDETGLNGILDWEFSGWGDPMSDIGWFCAECWRFSRPDLEAGGITTRQSFYKGYLKTSECSIDEQAVYFWEVIAHIRWAIITLQQANRHLSGAQLSLELALTGRLLPSIESQILNMTSPATWKTA
ncbi:MAG: phosphotransferase family protein, partial [Gammaproteobacteria bacterium]|nr:phosphotransferase family protein [Gammaproteobacteria bacterium]